MIDELAKKRPYSSRIEKDCYVVGGKGSFASCGACADYRLMVLARAKAGLELIGNLIEARGGVTHDEPGLAGACVARTHGAGLSRIVCSFSNFEARFGENAGDGVFLLVEREGPDCAGEVFDGVELVVADDYGDSNGIDVWIQ